MAEKKIVGYDYSGNPVYEAERTMTDEEFMRDLDRIVIMPDGKEYFELGDGQYCVADKNGDPDMSKVVTF